MEISQNLVFHKIDERCHPTMSVKSLKGTQSTNHIKPVASNWTPDNKDIALFMSAL